METTPVQGKDLTCVELNVLKFLFSIREFLVKHSRRKVEWTVVCANTPHQSCDFSGAPLYYLGIYLCRVQANASGTLFQSEYLKFHPDEHGERR